MSPINISTSGTIFRWRPAAWLRVTGEDAAAFLQGQFSNDLRELKAGNAVYGLWLTVKGKVLADSFVLRGAGENEFWIGSYASRSETIRERLEGYIIADDVTLEDVTNAWTALTWMGGATSGPPREVFAFRGRRGREDATEWVYLLSARERVERELGDVAELPAAEMTRRRIEANIPAVPADVGPADLPNEAGLEVDAISFTKGCYLGQEVMARLKSMGQVRRRLLRVNGTGEIPALPAPVFAGARLAGELRSAAAIEGGFIGLAMLSRLHVGERARLAFAAQGEERLNVTGTP